MRTEHAGFCACACGAMQGSTPGSCNGRTSNGTAGWFQACLQQQRERMVRARGHGRKQPPRRPREGVPRGRAGQRRGAAQQVKAAALVDL